MRNCLLEEVLQAPAGIAVAAGEEMRNCLLEGEMRDYLLEDLSREIVKVEYPTA
jgi:hypothetical protein